MKLNKRKTKGWTPFNDSSRSYDQRYAVPGIYAFKEFDTITRKYKTVYIGKSKNILKRIGLEHEVEKRWQAQQPNEFIQTKYLYMYTMATDDFDAKEIEYIKRLKPVFNKFHNSDYQRVYIYGK